MKIMLLSDSPTLPTGYSNQSKQLTKYLLGKGHEIYWLANGYTGVSLDYIKLSDGTEIKCKIIGSQMGDQYFSKTITKHIREFKIDKLIILLDTFMLYPWFLNIDTAPAETYFWFPSDGGGGLPKACESILKKIDKPVAMSRFGQKQVKDYHNLEVDYIPHGLDINRFYPLEEEEKIKLKEKWNLKDKFVIGAVARNQPRKNLDRTIKAMRLIADKIPNAVLFLHLDPNDIANPNFNILSLVRRYNLENRVVFSGMEAHKGFDWNKMNEVYNLMDVFLLTTSGEGFGIPIIEAMACEVPVVITNYTTTQELVIENKSGEGIKLSGTEEIDLFKEKLQDYDFKVINGTLTGSWEVERGMCDIEDCSERIVKLYLNPDYRKELGENGRKAVLEKYDFELVGKSWENLLNGKN